METICLATGSWGCYCHPTSPLHCRCGPDFRGSVGISVCPVGCVYDFVYKNLDPCCNVSLSFMTQLSVSPSPLIIASCQAWGPHTLFTLVRGHREEKGLSNHRAPHLAVSPFTARPRQLGRTVHEENVPGRQCRWVQPLPSIAWVPGSTGLEPSTPITNPYSAEEKWKGKNDVATFRQKKFTAKLGAQSRGCRFPRLLKVQVADYFKEKKLVIHVLKICRLPLNKFDKLTVTSLLNLSLWFTHFRLLVSSHPSNDQATSSLTSLPPLLNFSVLRFHSLAYILMNMLLQCLFCGGKKIVCYSQSSLSLHPGHALAGGFWNRSSSCREDCKVTLWMTEDSENDTDVQKLKICCGRWGVGSGEGCRKRGWRAEASLAEKEPSRKNWNI